MGARISASMANWSECSPLSTMSPVSMIAASGGASPSVAAPAETAELLRGDGEVVVLVEDDEMVRELVQRLLEKHGYAVRPFATGDACLDALGAQPEPADVLLTDVVMPGINGPDLRDRLHAAGLPLPALFMSGYTGDILLRRGLADARADFLQKPVMPEQLLRKLRAVLKKRVIKSGISSSQLSR